MALVALGRAESTWTRTAERYGDRTASALACLQYGDLEGYEAIVAATLPDVSWGYGQCTLGLARSYGLGDGSAESALSVRESLFDRTVAIEIAADQLAGCLAKAAAFDLAPWGISHELAALCIYNAGTLWPPDDPWWVKWAGNVRNYQTALKWAAGIIAASH